MGLFEFFFGKSEPRKKRVFISFAVEDMQYKDYLKQQADNKRSPFEFIDMSLKVKWNESEWKKECRRRIRLSDGVIALISKNTYHAGGARWEMKCAREEGVKIIGMHIQRNNKGTIPPELRGKKVIEWSWANLERFIKTL